MVHSDGRHSNYSVFEELLLPCRRRLTTFPRSAYVCCLFCNVPTERLAATRWPKFLLCLRLGWECFDFTQLRSTVVLICPRPCAIWARVSSTDGLSHSLEYWSTVCGLHMPIRRSADDIQASRTPSLPHVFLFRGVSLRSKQRDSGPRVCTHIPERKNLDQLTCIISCYSFPVRLESCRSCFLKTNLLAPSLKITSTLPYVFSNERFPCAVQHYSPTAWARVKPHNIRLCPPKKLVHYTKPRFMNRKCAMSHIQKINIIPLQSMPRLR